MRDGIDLARAGLPVVVIVTEDFRPQADFVAGALGMPGVPILNVPHPMAGRGLHFLQEVALTAAGCCLDLLQDGALND